MGTLEPIHLQQIRKEDKNEAKEEKEIISFCF